MSDLTQAMFNIINFPDDIPNALIDDLATVMEAARLVANPNIEAIAEILNYSYGTVTGSLSYNRGVAEDIAALFTPQGDTEVGEKVCSRCGQGAYQAPDGRWFHLHAVHPRGCPYWAEKHYSGIEVVTPPGATDE